MKEEERDGESTTPKTAERPTPKTTASSSLSLSLSLHDCLSLGEIELGLETRQNLHKDDVDGDQHGGGQEEYLRATEEVRRLPYLLRILSSTRPLASVQSFDAKKIAPKGDEDNEKLIDEMYRYGSNNDHYLDRIVDRLEDVAATYSVAGGIDVITNHLAPSVSKNLSRLPSLRKIYVDDNDDEKNSQHHQDYYWDTEELAAMSRDPLAKRKRRRKDVLLTSNKKPKHAHDGTDTSNAPAGINDIHENSSDEDEKPGAIQLAPDVTTDIGRASLSRKDSVLVAAEDSQESTVIKTLSELASLVVASLDHRRKHDVEGEDDHQQHPGAPSGGKRASSLLSLNTDDILSEKAASIPTSGRISADVGGGAMEGNDLSSTIVAIMHNAPVLKSRDVANALCRASVPQTGDIISRLGANCPASVPSLLLGCIEAYSMSIEHHRVGDSDGISNSNGNNAKVNLSCPIVSASKSAITSLARLSKTESCRVRNKLEFLGVMIDMQLKLTLEEATILTEGKEVEHYFVPLACLLREHLSFPKIREIESDHTDSMTMNMRATGVGPVEEREKVEVMQSPRDQSIDSPHTKQVIDFATACSKGVEPSLLLHFFLTPQLYTQTLDYFSQVIKYGASIPPSSSTGIKKSLGKWSLILRAYALLLLVPLLPSTVSSGGALILSFQTSVKEFMALLRNLDGDHGNHRSRNSEDRPKQSKMDTLLGLILSSAVLLSSSSLAIESKEGQNEHERVAQTVQTLQIVFETLRAISDQSNMLLISFEDQVRKGDTWGIFKRALYPLELTACIEDDYVNNSYRSRQIGLNLLCRGLQPVLDQRKSEIKLDVSFNLPFRLQALRRGLESSEMSFVEETEKFLRSIIKEEREDEVLSLVENVESAQFVVEATNFLVEPNSSQIPLVLPTHIDMAWSRIASEWNLTEENSTIARKCNFLFQLLYAFHFLDKSPRSPFAFDPRSSPIKESISMIHDISSDATRNFLLFEFEVLMRKHCPEMLRFEWEQRLRLRASPPFDTMDRKTTLAALCNSIRDHLNGDKAMLDEKTTEHLFLLAKARMCHSDVYAAVTNSFLSQSHTPSPNYSYRRLYQDPIVCLKFPLSVWRCRCLRRIALSVLENLLMCNSAITIEESRLEETALELLVARDAIVLRCLLAVLHGGDSKNLVTCSMTTNFIRWMIQSRPGLVALLVKQGIQERELDWLVENVPETMNDSRYLLQIFSERNCLTAAERLVAADSSIRIAIVHGGASETESCQLILSAISLLVDSFYLIIGPVGLLPVDALFNTESGTLITQVSQKAAFRILKALTKVRGMKNHTRRDCSAILQKLINLCKGELQGTVSGRRKQIIKELYEAAIKVEK